MDFLKVSWMIEKQKRKEYTMDYLPKLTILSSHDGD